MKKIRQFFRDNWMFIIPISLILTTILFYAYRFGFYFLDNKPENSLYEKYGQFGDYFGGVINPILAFINILLIVYYQKTDFKIQQIQANNQDEKNQIITLINMHCTLRDQLTILDKGHEIKGLALFVRIDNEIRNIYRDKYDKSELKPLEKLELAYTYIFENQFRKQYLGHYYRSLYQIYKYIDKSLYISSDEKMDLAKLLRSQISHLELKLLFLNAISDYGSNFQYYIAKYDILEWFYESDFKNYSLDVYKTEIIRETIEEWKSKLTTAST